MGSFTISRYRGKEWTWHFGYTIDVAKTIYFFHSLQVPLDFVVGAVLTCPSGKIMLRVSPRD